MAHYSLERRESVVRRMLNEGISMSALARETGIAEGTLYRWHHATTPNGETVAVTRKHSVKHSASQKLASVVQAASLNEAELAEYCRKQGLYPEHVKAWRAQAEQALGADGAVSASLLREALTTEKKRNRALERELHRKDRALAETAALLVLRKKAAAIWGEDEDA